MLGASKCPFVAGLFPPIAEESTKSSKFSSIGSRFKVNGLVISFQMEIYFLIPIPNLVYATPNEKRDTKVYNRSNCPVFMIWKDETY